MKTIKIKYTKTKITLNYNKNTYNFKIVSDIMNSSFKAVKHIGELIGHNFKTHEVYDCLSIAVIDINKLLNLLNKYNVKAVIEKDTIKIV